MKMNLNKIMANVLIQFIILLPIQISLSLAAPNIHDIAAMPLDNTRMQVNFTTDEPAKSIVYIGFDEGLGIEGEKESDYAENHSMTIAQLQPDTEYFYKIVAENETGISEESDIKQVITYKTNEIKDEDVNLTKLREEPLDTVVIEWKSMAESDSIIYYGNASDNLDRFVKGADGVKDHSVTLSGLEKGKKHYYKVRSSYVESSIDSFTTPVDITPPTITYTKPAESTINKTLVIKGSLSENATLEIRSNVQPLTIDGDTKVRLEEGDFEITVELVEGLNKVEMTATDEHDNYAREYFNVTVDTEGPKITLVDFSPYAPFKDYNLTVMVDEDSKITIKLNNAIVRSTTDYVNNFTKILAITKENNTLEVIAEDAAGNIATETREIRQLEDLFLEILAPNITDKEAAQKIGNRYKISWGVADIRIQGRTNPNTQIVLWKSMVELTDVKDKTPDYNTTSNEEGYFSIEIPIEKIATRGEYEKYNKSYNSRDIAAYESLELKFDTQPEFTYFLRIEARDDYGRKNKEGAITLEIVREKCGSSYPWVVHPERDTHDFKPYRLKDGNEMLTFKLRLSWIGLGENEEVQGVTIKQQTRTLQMLDNEDYDCFTKGEILPRRPKVSMPNENGTYWYIMYKLAPWKGLNDSIQDEWADAFYNMANKKCILPVKAVIRYSYTDINGTPVTTEQEFCIKQVNHIQDQLDPRKVFPPKLLDFGIGFVNTTLTVLGPIEKTLYWVNVGTRVACYTTLLNYAYKKIRVRLTCGRAIITNKQNPDPNEAEGCAKQIQELKALYNKYRLACDRVWCKSAPADPGTYDPTVPGSGELEGEAIKRRPGPKDDKCKKDPDYICVEGPALFEYYCGTKYPRVYSTPDCPVQNEGTAKHQICCRRIDKGILEKVDKIKDEKKVFDSADDWWWKGEPEPTYRILGFIPVSVQRAVSDEDKAWNFGAWAGYGAEKAEDLVKPTIYTGILGMKEAKKMQIEIRKELKGRETTGANYSYDTYVSGIYAPSCFNKQPLVGWLFGKRRLYLAPSQNFFDSVQCRCVSDIYGRVRQWRNILQELQNCMQQVKKTGQANAGACKQLFTRYACDLITWVLVKGSLALTDTIDVGLKKDERDPDMLPAGSAVKLGFQEAIDSFKDDYGGSMRPGTDFSMDYLTHSVCLAAFGNPWNPGLKGMFGLEQEGPPRQSAVLIIPASRELLGANPLTGTATYEYRVGVSVTAGSKLRKYEVWLICDQYGDCSGQPKSRLFRSEPEIPYGRITDIGQNEFSSVGGSMYVDNEQFRYNKVKVTWVSADGPEFSNPIGEVVDIGATESLELFDCSVAAGAGLGGNDLLQCGFLQTGTFAEFIRPPPTRHTEIITQDNQEIKIPFSVKGEYETIEEELNPLLLGIDEVTKEEVLMERFKAQEIRSGTFTNKDFVMPIVSYNKLFSAGEAEIKAEGVKQTGEDEAPKCTLTIKTPGTIIKTGDIFVIFPDDPKETDLSKVYVEDYGKYGLSEKATIPNPPLSSHCKAPNCQYENGVLTLKIEETTVELRVNPKKECKISVKATGGLARNQVIKYYKIGIYQNNGEGDLGAIVTRGLKKQQQIVEVTLNKGSFGQEVAPELKDVPEEERQQILSTGIKITTDSKTDPKKPITGTKGKEVSIKVIVEGVSGEEGATFNYVKYIVENPYTKPIIENVEVDGEEKDEEDFTVKFTPKESGKYRLVVQAGKEVARGTSVMRRRTFDIDVGAGVAQTTATEEEKGQ